MDEKYVESFKAIVNFVDDIFEVYGNSKKASPLNLYRRLIGHIEESDGEALNKVLCPFQEFIGKYDNVIMENRLDVIPRETRIRYGTSDTVYIDIQKFIHLSRQDHDAREAIRQHLIAISAILEPNGKKLEELDKRMNELNVDTTTNEGKFITDILGRAKTNMDGLEDINMENPTQAIMGLLSSGVIQDMLTGIQEGVKNGDMDMHKLLGSMHSAMGSLMPPPPPNKNSVNNSSQDVEEIEDDEPDKK